MMAKPPLKLGPSCKDTAVIRLTMVFREGSVSQIGVEQDSPVASTIAMGTEQRAISVTVA